MNLDAINNSWNQWVLGYDQDKQLKLLKKLIHKDIAWGDIGLVLVIALISLMILVSYFLLRNNAIALDPVKKTYLKFLKKLEKAGVNKQTNEGVISFGERAALNLTESLI